MIAVPLKELIRHFRRSDCEILTAATLLTIDLTPRLGPVSIIRKSIDYYKMICQLENSIFETKILTLIIIIDSGVGEMLSIDT